jgi:phospholipase/carboxylesterase
MCGCPEFARYALETAEFMVEDLQDAPKRTISWNRSRRCLAQTRTGPRPAGRRLLCTRLYASMHGYEGVVPSVPNNERAQRRSASRRRVLKAGAGAVAALAIGCGAMPSGARRSGTKRGIAVGDLAAEGRLTARPRRAPTVPIAADLLKPGRHEILIESGRRAILAVPRNLNPSVPAPFALGLHGASGRAEAGLRVFGSLAEDAGVIELAPEAERGAWDVMFGAYGADVGFIDRMLAWSFARFAIDSGRLACTGFSNGASYTLSLGLTNGDLFSHLVAFSPGFMAPADLVGRPPIFVAHGTEDRALPIDKASRTFVPRLRDEGYDVTYHEFVGKHEISPRQSSEAIDWLLV